ncbi:hypothetical protein A0U40_13475 [[Bacillus] sp. KCTC 13219]|nr:hypothetical protein A0U40_13475 [[Bacillus] sp. KCTC 13219]
MKPAVRLAQIELDTPNWEDNPKLVAEVASYLKVSTQTVRNRVWSGKEGRQGSAKGIRIERIILKRNETEGEVDEVV